MPRCRPLIIVAAPLAGLLLFLVVISRVILLESFAELEAEQVRRNVQRVLASISDDLATLHSKSGDWSNWDDTYAFMRDRNPRYIRANLVDNAFIDLGVNLFMFMRPSGEVVYGRAFDLQHKRETPVPQELKRHLAAGGFLRRAAAGESVTGMLLLPEGPMLVAVRPIQTSQGKGPVRGALVMGRWLDQEAVHRLAGISRLSLRVFRLDIGLLPADFQEARRRLSAGEDVGVSPLGNSAIAGYAFIRDIYGAPSLLMRVDMPRSIYRQGETTIRYFLLWFLAVSLLFGAAGWLLLSRLLLSRRREAETEERYRAVVEQAAEGILLIDPETGNFLEANSAFRKLLGYDREELPGMTLFDLDPHDDPEDIDVALRESVREKGFFSGGRRLQRKDGGLLDVELSAGPISCEEKERLCVVVRDVTERRKLEEELRQSQKLEAVGQLAGGVAHDFNNILSAIIGYGGLIDMQLKTEDPLRQDLDQLLAAADRAAHLTHGLLAFSRKQILDPKPVDVNAVVRNAGKFLARLIGEDIEFRMLLSDRKMTVVADSSQIDQVLMNLATNGRDAMPEGGVLTVETACEELDERDVQKYGYGRPGNYALIAVSDTGSGMDEATRQRIFEPFFTTKELGKGTGLGLAIVYGIVKQHNGYINCYSEPGKGTTFRIHFPLTGIGAEEAEKEASAAEPPTGTETVLVAEDDARVRRLTREVLERFGYRVIEAVDGEDAVARFREGSDEIRLVILDVMMPKKNGKEAYDEIRGIAPGMKALFTSGYTAYVLHRKRILEEGVNVLSKPIVPNDLLRKVREALDSPTPSPAPPP